MTKATTSTLGNCTSTAASGKSQVKLLVVLALFLCSFAASAAAWTLVTAPASIWKLQVGTTQVWALDYSGNAYQYSGGSFVSVSGGPFKGIAVGKGDSVWTRDGSDNVYQYNFKTKKFDLVTGSLWNVEAGGQGVWGLDTSGTIYMWNGTAFVTPPHGQPKGKSFQQASVGSFEIGVWAVDSSSVAWLYNSTTQYFDSTGGAKLVQISVGTAQVWGINSSGQAVNYNVVKEKWETVDPTFSITEIEAGNTSNVWGLADGGYLVKLVKGKFKSQSEPELLSDVRVSSGTAGIFVLGVDGNVYKH